MLFTGNAKLENKFSKGESMRHEIESDRVYVADRTQVPVKNSVKQGRGGGVNREEGLINFPPLKRGAY